MVINVLRANLVARARGILINRGARVNYAARVRKFIHNIQLSTEQFNGRCFPRTRCLCRTEHRTSTQATNVRRGFSLSLSLSLFRRTPPCIFLLLVRRISRARKKVSRDADKMEWNRRADKGGGASADSAPPSSPLPAPPRPAGRAAVSRETNKFSAEVADTKPSGSAALPERGCRLFMNVAPRRLTDRVSPISLETCRDEICPSTGVPLTPGRGEFMGLPRKVSNVI